MVFWLKERYRLLFAGWCVAGIFGWKHRNKYSNSTIDHARHSDYDGSATNPEILTGLWNIQIKEKRIMPEEIVRCGSLSGFSCQRHLLNRRPRSRATAPVWKITSTDTWMQCSLIRWILSFLPGPAGSLKTGSSFPLEERGCGTACQERGPISFMSRTLRHNKLLLLGQSKKAGQPQAQRPHRSQTCHADHGLPLPSV